MKKDLPQNVVSHIGVAIVLEEAMPETRLWNVYLLNLKKGMIHTVLVSSKGYGTKDGEEVKTSVLRHSLGSIEARTYALIEAIDEQVFGLTNEYWVSYYIDAQIYDKKFIFLPESIIDTNMIRIPILNKPGVLIS